MDVIAQLYQEPNRSALEELIFRHLVSLQYLERRPAGSPRESKEVWPRPHIATGFLFAYRRRWLWVTAGHVIENLERRKAQGLVFRASLNDGLHNPMPGEMGIPLPLGERAMLWLDNDVVGADAGAIVLHTHEARLLASNGTTPILDRMVGAPKAKYDAYVMVGFPDSARKMSFVRTKAGGEGWVELGTLLLPLERVQRPDRPRTPVERLYFRILPHRGLGTPAQMAEGISDAHGMSGGPIFGVRVRDGRAVYRLVGIQSAQLDTTKDLVVTPARDMLRAFVNRFEREFTDRVNALA